LLGWRRSGGVAVLGMGMGVGVRRTFMGKNGASACQ
jgi:hypothetical protein